MMWYEEWWSNIVRDLEKHLLSCTRDHRKWGSDSLFPNCPNLTSLVLCTIWSYSTSLHITPHIPIIEIRDTETAIIWKWGTLKQQVRYGRVKWNSEGMAIDWGKLYVLKDLFFYFLFFEMWKKDLFLLFE